MAEINTYDKALNFILNKQSLGIKPGLSRIKNALEKAGNPQNTYKVIHVAGTNGKGTVAATIAKALTDSGYNVGLFTSPWVVDYREQIQLNGDFISESAFINGVEKLAGTNCECTEFEALTFISYSFFADKKVDFAVIECGMGGKGDATNVEEDNLSVITSISLDHTDFLGNTIDDIAEEKSGILRMSSTCVLYNGELRAHFENKCKKLVTDCVSDNLSLVNAVLKELNVIGVNALVRLPARQEKIGNILLDGGHNVSAAKALEGVIENETAVIGMMRDKDIEGYLKIIAPKCKKIILTTPDNPRAINAKDLSIIAKKFCKNVKVIDNPVLAVKERGVTLVCGSFYLARQVRNLL